ncbi:MAG: hypothetical protein MUC97_17430 [Bernardetiaceae bacterium]|nr:hypothetical protein [Bernardetiaceae bacterium]
MLFFTKRLFILVIGITGLNAVAQAQIAAIPGWQMTTAPQAATFRYTQGSNGITYHVRPPQARASSQWFTEAVAADLKKEGWQETKKGVTNSVYGLQAFITEVLSPSGQKWLVGYLGYPLGNDRARLGRTFSTTDQAFFKTHMAKATEHFTALAVKEGGLDLTAKPKATDQSPTVATAEPTPKPNQQSAGLPAGAPGKGLAPSQIKRAIIHLEYRFGVGGAVYPTYVPYLLLTDGSIYANPIVCPYDLNVTASKQSEPNKWGTWKTTAGGLEVYWPTKKPKDQRSTWKASTIKDAPAARPGETLDGGFKSISGGGNTALGGDVMIVNASQIRFGRNGQFSYAKASGGSGSGWATSGNSNEAGTYRLDQHLIELRFNNGTVERRFFYFYPDSRQHFGISTRAYVPQDK